MIKDTGEVELIRSAVTCAAEAFNTVRPMMKPAVSERELAAKLDYRMALAGADGPAFDTLVASGPNSALPHAPLTGRSIAETDMVVIDFGAARNGIPF